MLLDKNKKKKIVLLLLLLVVSLAFLLLWLWGKTKKEDNSFPSGLNVLLPEARLKKRDSTKLSFYELGKGEGLETDSFLQTELTFKKGLENSAGEQSHSTDPAAGLYSDKQGTNEEKMYRKLAEIEDRLKRPKDLKTQKPYFEKNRSVLSDDLVRLKTGVEAKEKTQGRDSELEALNTMMEKVLDIQHPERVKERMRSDRSSPAGEVQSIEALEEAATISLLSATAQKERGESARRLSPATIRAVVPVRQIVQGGAVVKLRLLHAINVKDVVLPAGTFLFGRTALQGDRLTINVSTITYNNELIPVQLSVYDLDGLEGIAVQQGTSQQAAGESANILLQRMGLPVTGASPEAQAASAGIQAAKTLLTRKVKAVRLTLPEGYEVLLRDHSIAN